MGSALNKSTPLIEKENFIENDILQGDFEDTYHSVTKKVIMGFHFVKTHCPRAQRILVADDDTLILPWNLYPNVMVNVTNEEDLYYSGFIAGKNVPFRDPQSRWYVKPHEYNCTLYPKYVVGTFYVMSMSTMKIFHYLSQVISLFFFEDVYFGILARISNVSITPFHEGAVIHDNCPELFATHKSQTVNNLIACHNMDDTIYFMLLWSEICYSATSSKATHLLIKYCS